MHHFQVLLNPTLVRAAVVALRTLMILDAKMDSFDVNLELPFSSKVFATSVTRDPGLGFVLFAHVLVQSGRGRGDKSALGAAVLLKHH